jgi:hypothetical protein
MKIAVKPKAEAQDRLILRIPISLKQQIEDTRTLANKCNVDYNATIIDALARFNADLRTQLLDSEAESSQRAAKPGAQVERSIGSGSDPGRASPRQINGAAPEPKLNPGVVE